MKNKPRPRNAEIPMILCRVKDPRVVGPTQLLPLPMTRPVIETRIQFSDLLLWTSLKCNSSRYSEEVEVLEEDKEFPDTCPSMKTRCRRSVTITIFSVLKICRFGPMVVLGSCPAVILRRLITCKRVVCSHLR
jgi:hypothetical protein